jgi:hypothetical protein
MTEQQKSDYEAHGYLLLEDALDATALDRTRQAFDAAQDLEDLPNQNPIFIHLAEHDAFFPHVHRVIGDVIQLRSVEGRRIAPDDPGQAWQKGTDGMLGVHHALSTVGVEVVIHLDDVTQTSACLSVVPASHRFKTDLPLPDVKTIEEMPHHVPLCVKAGTAILSHANIWKACTRNQGDTTQRSIVYTYNHCWMRQALPDLSPEGVDTIAESHNLSQLFGIDPDVSHASKYWSRSVEGYPSSKGLPDRKFAERKVVGQGVKPNR